MAKGSSSGSPNNSPRGNRSYKGLGGIAVRIEQLSPRRDAARGGAHPDLWRRPIWPVACLISLPRLSSRRSSACIVRTETRSWRAAALVALFFIGSPYLYHWIPLFRVDLIGLAFAFGGVYCVWVYMRADARASSSSVQQDAHKVKRTGFLITFGWRLPFCCFLLALYTKHTLFAAPAAAFFALYRRNNRTAFAFAAVLGAVGGALYLGIDAVTAGGFTFGLLESNATTFLPEQLFALTQNFVSTFPIILLLAFWGWLARVRAKQVGVLEWYAAISMLMLVMAGRVGAWEKLFL